MFSKFDLDHASKKLAQRSEEAHAKAQRKLERDRIIAERKKKREEAIEREIQERRMAERVQQEAREQERERLRELNQGVVYQGSLQAVPASFTVATEKGIKRSADKALLPPSVGATLLSQDASKNGAYFFHIENALGRHTCVGLLEFSSAEGFIALPRKAVRCLWGPDADDESVSGSVAVTYTRLPKGTRVVFQPRSARFQEAIGDDIRDVLERCLSQHSCLSVGDWVTVMHGEEVFDVRVRELEPETSVSIIDTEMEAEVHPSIETEEKILQEEMEARRRMEEREKRRQEEGEKESRLAHRAQQHDEITRQKRETLPEEGPDDPSTDIIVLFRFPNGEKHQRRFCLSDPLSLLFHAVDAKGASGLFPGEYRLVSQYPRHVFNYQDDTSSHGSVLKDIEWFSPGSRLVLFLEPMSETEEVGRSADVRP